MLDKDTFLEKYHLKEKDLTDYNIDWNTLVAIYEDFQAVRTQLELHASAVADILRSNKKIHTVRSRVKDTEHLIAKLIRKTPDRQEKKGKDFQFTVENFKSEITDLVGLRAIHIFKEDWEQIHNFIKSTWEVVEEAANIRKGDDEKPFEELGVEVTSRESGYRSVHYLIEFYPTRQKITAEIQVRTIFEEGYGEIDHLLRYPHGDVPDVLSLNLLLLNRIAGSSDEVASFINRLKSEWITMEQQIDKKTQEIVQQKQEIEKLKAQIEGSNKIDEPEKESLMSHLQNLESINKQISTQIVFNKDWSETLANMPKIGMQKIYFPKINTTNFKISLDSNNDGNRKEHEDDNQEKDNSQEGDS